MEREERGVTMRERREEERGKSLGLDFEIGFVMRFPYAAVRSFDVDLIAGVIDLEDEVRIGVKLLDVEGEDVLQELLPVVDLEVDLLGDAHPFTMVRKEEVFLLGERGDR